MSIDVDVDITFSMTIFKPCYTRTRAKYRRINEDRRPDTLAKAQAILSALAALRSVTTARRDWSLYAEDSLRTFHLGVFKAIAGLVDDAELTMDRIPLVDGKLESRHTQEGFVTEEEQSLLVKLIRRIQCYQRLPMAPGV